MALLEFEYLRKINRVRLPAEEIAAALASDLGVRVCEVSFAGVGRQALSEGWTTDPFDRLIVAAAQVERLTVVTSDAQLRLYDVPIVDAGK